MTHMFIPGPVDVAPEVMQAMTKPMIPHRSKEFDELFKRTGEGMQKVYLTQNRVFQPPASGSGMQEAAMRNLVDKDVLVCTNGAFADRWFEVAVCNGKQAVRLSAEWGSVHTPDMLREVLKVRHYEAVAIVHNETSTGAENPVKELSAVIHEVSPDTLVLVDAVSSLAGTRIETDAWGLDFVLTSSQKCLALPPGMSFAAVSDRAMAKAATVPNRGWYFDLLLLEKHRIKDSTAMTPTMQILFGLDFQLERIFAEGLENRWARHAAMGERVRAWGFEHDMPPLTDLKYASKTVSTLKNTRGLDVSALNAFLKTRGMRIANGYGSLKDKTIRIAHMGETNMGHIEELLAAMEDFLKQS
jgi:aspartate aminotransferase-like enzyme